MGRQTAVCFDLDGTVTREEILPLISKNLGIFEEINLLTQITLKGLIPFQNSFKLRVKLLGSIPISEVRAIVNKTHLDPYIQNFIQQNQEDCYIITGNLDIWIKELVAENLGCQFFSSTASHADDKLIELTSILDKKDAVNSLRDQYEHIVVVGDSMNDCSMFEVADTKIAFGGVHDPVASLISLADYVVYDSQGLIKLLNNRVTTNKNSSNES